MLGVGRNLHTLVASRDRSIERRVAEKRNYVSLPRAERYSPSNHEQSSDIMKDVLKHPRPALFKNVYIQLQVYPHSHHGGAIRRREQETENLFEKTTENFPNLVKEIDVQVQEVQRVPNKMSPKRSTPRHIIIKMPQVKDKKRILKAAREK